MYKQALGVCRGLALCLMGWLLSGYVKSWTDWFVAAKESEIPALVKFAEQKEKRLPGLAAHAIYPISTGKLEGFNNKITPSYLQCCKYSYPHAQQPLICLNEE